MPLSVIDQPVALAGQITVDRMQGGPQFSRCRDGLSPTRLALEMMHDHADAIDADRALLALPFHNRQCRRSTSPTITAFAGIVTVTKSCCMPGGGRDWRHE